MRGLSCLSLASPRGKWPSETHFLRSSVGWLCCSMSLNEGADIPRSDMPNACGLSAALPSFPNDPRNWPPETHSPGGTMVCLVLGGSPLFEAGGELL